MKISSFPLRRSRSLRGVMFAKMTDEKAGQVSIVIYGKQERPFWFAKVIRLRTTGRIHFPQCTIYKHSNKCYLFNDFEKLCTMIYQNNNTVQ